MALHSLATSTVTDFVPNPDVVYRTDFVSYYTNDQTNWLLGLVTRQVSKPFVNGVGDAAGDRTASFTYFSGTPLVNVATREPDQAAPIKLTTTYAKDAFGNVTSQTTTPSEGTANRVESVAFDSAGRFPSTLTNAVGQVTTLGFDARFGALSTVDGPNATTGSYNDLATRVYDAFGRLEYEDRIDGSFAVVAVDRRS